MIAYQQKIMRSADGWADDVRLSDIEPKFTCTHAVRKGRDPAEFPEARMGTG